MTAEKEIKKIVDEELKSMSDKHGATFASLPEAFAVTLEEVEETAEEMEEIKSALNSVWQAIRGNLSGAEKEKRIKKLYEKSISCIQECTQVAACCQKTLRGKFKKKHWHK